MTGTYDWGAYRMPFGWVVIGCAAGVPVRAAVQPDSPGLALLERRWVTCLEGWWHTGAALPFIADPQATPFAARVWQVVAGIPVGQTMRYAAVAQAMDCPGAARAVGQVMARNRLGLFRPCHRVVGQTGLGGFAWGLLVKAALLAREADHARTA